MPPFPVASLNALIGLPSRHPRWAFGGGREAAWYFLDYTHLDAARARACLGELPRARGERGLDFARKGLLVAARSVEADHGALLAVVREFAEHHVFFEPWISIRDVKDLHNERLDNVYLLPVTAGFQSLSALGPLPRGPARRVFVSLGGDDDLDLVREVVRRRDDLHFCIPDLAWTGRGPDRRLLAVHVPGRNVTRVACGGRFHLLVSPGYRWAFARCDTVLVATRREPRDQMRGGTRVADALCARKRLVMTENAMCELLMAQHGKTCLVTRHDADEAAAALGRIGDPSVGLDEGLSDEIRPLTRDAGKLAWMMRVPFAPGEARRSAFFRDPARLRSELARLGPPGSGALATTTALGLTRGDLLPLPGGGAVRVDDLREESPARYRITLVRAAGAGAEAAPRPFHAVLSTEPVVPHYRRTVRGYWLSYEGSGLSAADEGVLEALARRV